MISSTMASRQHTSHRELNIGTFGFSVVSVSYGDILNTIRADTESGYEDRGTFSPSAIAVGVGFARSFTDRFSVGAHVKYVEQDLGTQLITSDDLS